MTASCPAWLVTAPASGQGKTSLVAGLARLHRRAGRRVQVFKCGPDFLDPQIHAVASGQPCETIDFSMAGDADARARLARAAAHSDLILVEGVMGLHDGSPDSATLARQLGLPILLVLDGSGMAGSFGAIAWGLRHHGDGAPVHSVLANRLGSEHHAQRCRDSLPPDIHWAGHLLREDAISLPERHLGLLPATEIADLDTRLDHIADRLRPTPAAALPPAVRFHGPRLPTPPPLLAGRTIAIARDAAFGFIYPANLECLQGLGAHLRFFSPLADGAPPSCDAIWLPGGYPELHAPQLAANRTMAVALAGHVAGGKPLLAECGGMMACFEHLHTGDGKEYPLFGLLPGRVTMQQRLAGLGLLHAELPEGPLHGHTFHYSTVTTPLAPIATARHLRRSGGEAIYRRQRLTASYLHGWFAGQPATVAALFSPQPAGRTRPLP